MNNSLKTLLTSFLLSLSGLHADMRVQSSEETSSMTNSASSLCKLEGLSVIQVAKVEHNLAPLKRAIKSKDSKAIQTFLEKDNIHELLARDKRAALDILNCAVKSGKSDIVQALFEDVDPNLETLKYAIWRKNLKTIQVVFEKRNIQDLLARNRRDALKILNCAMKYSSVKLVRIFLKKIKPNLETLILAIQWRNLKIIQAVFEKERIQDILTRDRGAVTEISNCTVRCRKINAIKTLIASVAPNLLNTFLYAIERAREINQGAVTLQRIEPAVATSPINLSCSVGPSKRKRRQKADVVTQGNESYGKIKKQKREDLTTRLKFENEQIHEFDSDAYFNPFEEFNSGSVCSYPSQGIDSDHEIPGIDEPDFSFFDKKITGPDRQISKSVYSYPFENEQNQGFDKPGLSAFV